MEKKISLFNVSVHVSTTLLKARDAPAGVEFNRRQLIKSLSVAVDWWNTMLHGVNHQRDGYSVSFDH